MSTFLDPETSVETALNAAYSTAGTPPLSIEPTFPTSGITKGTYRLQLDFEGDAANDYPATARATVRVVVWGNKGDRTFVKAQADRVRDLLDAAALSGVAGFVPGGRSAVAQDDATTNLSCFIRVRVDLLATPVAS